VDAEDDVLSCLCLNLRRSARRLTQKYDDALRPSGLKITQFTLLAALEGFERTTLQPLADFMGMDRTTLTRNLALLERDGLVTVARGEQDRREQWITLSPAGCEAVKKAMPFWRTAQSAAMATLGESEAKRLLDELRQVSENVESRP
jgi:DNA-binding MarR family transcriptional regulator